MERFETVWEFKTARFRIEYSVAPDCDVDLSWDDSGEVREKLNNDELFAFVARLAVYWDGAEVGTDYLGGCIYESPLDFIDHRGRKAHGYGSYFSDMVRAAIQDARRRLANAPKLRAA